MLSWFSIILLIKSVFPTAAGRVSVRFNATAVVTVVKLGAEEAVPVLTDSLTLAHRLGPACLPPVPLSLIQLTFSMCK